MVATSNKNNPLSKRLQEIVAALPLREGLRILEIGCGTGAMARAIAKRYNTVYLLGVDRSAKAIEQCIAGSRAEIASGKLHFCQVAIEDFEWAGDQSFDLAIAVRVGALGGRRPEKEARALSNIAKALKPGGKLYIDGGTPLKEITVKR